MFGWLRGSSNGGYTPPENGFPVPEQWGGLGVGLIKFENTRNGVASLMYNNDASDGRLTLNTLNKILLPTMTQGEIKAYEEQLQEEGTELPPLFAKKLEGYESQQQAVAEAEAQEAYEKTDLSDVDALDSVNALREYVGAHKPGEPRHLRDLTDGEGEPGATARTALVGKMEELGIVSGAEAQTLQELSQNVMASGDDPAAMDRFAGAVDRYLFSPDLGIDPSVYARSNVPETNRSSLKDAIMEGRTNDLINRADFADTVENRAKTVALMVENGFVEAGSTKHADLTRAVYGKTGQGSQSVEADFAERCQDIVKTQPGVVYDEVPPEFKDAVPLSSEINITNTPIHEIMEGGLSGVKRLGGSTPSDIPKEFAYAEPISSKIGGITEQPVHEIMGVEHGDQKTIAALESAGINLDTSVRDFEGASAAQTLPHDLTAEQATVDPKPFEIVSLGHDSIKLI